MELSGSLACFFLPVFLVALVVLLVTLALEYDVDAIQDAGLIDDGWVDEFPEDSAPYTSTIVFLVRKGNPKNIKDWDDLVKKDVGVITPNPKTSGGARWNYLAAWAYAKDKYNGDEDKIKEFIGDLYKNVLVLDTGARGATTSFVENGQGDVLIAWENEAYLSVKDYPDDYEIVTPSINIILQCQCYHICFQSVGNLKCLLAGTTMGLSDLHILACFFLPVFLEALVVLLVKLSGRIIRYIGDADTVRRIGGYACKTSNCCYCCKSCYC